ncbi:transglycosylase-like protein with SLT domain [Rhodothalassium salexigens DSM 2132]|uniref:Transglycosylase-like protein with SLT domain n=1 Tax=Rhodothalassium salexigens DSM 2132 TaxID=1188247 RepID=A0A4R2PIJ1_RHOSA|nr:lytic transglycosylase domain-containing protein [Rhodothalassium salexigens]MBB4211359.1 soluble lytic murein transglycosylase-like protein [Rhodothalassium salexigens DSM 2132]MBK1637693.1 hypothetical protein [Rhodothalassium salexigens DSM 2132]TCP35280.1 transglycosylase-like protein with SLT domain [Rhodothalassium salexigens DSM 2132]
MAGRLCVVWGRRVTVWLLALATIGIGAAADEPAAPWPAAEVRVLSPSDAVRYRRVFQLQEDGQWAAADAQIAQIDDRILMGHVLFQRYMHPTAYRSRYDELRDWLAEYADHPGAQRVYALARRRQGRAAAPRRPDPVVLRSWAGLDVAAAGAGASTAAVVPTPRAKPDSGPRRSRAERRQVAAVEALVARYLRLGRPDRAEKRLWAAADLLTPAERSAALAATAAAYFRDHDDAKAAALGRHAMALAPAAAGADAWAVGLAIWRSGDCTGAEPAFALVAEQGETAERRAAGAVWAARAALVCGSAGRVSTHLRRALGAPESFYGLLARAQLGLPPLDDWQGTPGQGTPGQGASGQAVDDDDMAALRADPAVRRVIALVDAGQYFRADQDLRLIVKRRGHTHWRALGALAAALDLPATQLYVGRHAGAAAPRAWRFPVPAWLDEAGLALDRALVLGVIRQESAFRHRARSHAGASGLMQLMPSTAGMMARDQSLRWRRNRLYQPDLNLELGQRYLDVLRRMERTDGNLLMMLAAYNGGPGNLARWKRQTEYLADPLLYVETLPVSETRTYVKRVMANLWLYRMRLGQAAPSLDALAANAWPLYEQLDPPGAVTVAGRFGGDLIRGP